MPLDDDQRTLLEIIAAARSAGTLTQERRERLDNLVVRAARHEQALHEIAAFSAGGDWYLDDVIQTARDALAEEVTP